MTLHPIAAPLYRTLGDNLVTTWRQLQAKLATSKAEVALMENTLRVIEATAAVTGTTLSDVDAIRFLDTVGDEEPIAA